MMQTRTGRGRCTSPVGMFRLFSQSQHQDHDQASLCTQLDPLSADCCAADQGLESLIHPLDRGHVKLLGHIPYARRRVTAVLPSLSDPSLPAFQRRLYRLITVPAPWTEAEAWRRLSTDKRQSENDNFQNPLEGEETTIAEPDELAIWVESDAIPEGQADRLVGMGLRGRWGLFGAGQDEAWWAFTTKDCEYSSTDGLGTTKFADVLPALWYSGGDEAQERD